MASSLKALAAAVDDLAKRGLATVIETRGALNISALAPADAASVVALVHGIVPAYSVVDSAGETADLNRLTEDYAPFIVTVQKELGATLRVWTLKGFSTFLSSEITDEIWEVLPLNRAFQSQMSAFVPWGGSIVYSPAGETKSPRKLVREAGAPSVVPEDIRRWITRAPIDLDQWRDPAVAVFLDLSTKALVLSLASEIDAEKKVVIKGPPYTKLTAPSEGDATTVGLDGYNALRSAAAWVYENSKEAEQRHGLFGAQLARSLPPNTSAASAFGAFCNSALDGAKLAYQLSLSDLTREAIKAQGDLRKAVVDDTSKIAENTRQVIVAVTAALATSIGLFVARLGTKTPPEALRAIGIIVCLYVAGIVLSGYSFIRVQRQLRREWRLRLYSFIPDQDFKAMVQDPIEAAEWTFTVAVIIAVIVGVLALYLALFSAPT